MKKTLYLGVLLLLSVVTLAGCPGGGGEPELEIGGDGEPGLSVLLASGGTGSAGAGGTGGQLSIETTGSAQVLISGIVDASFMISAVTPSFGGNGVVVTDGTTTVQSNTDTIPGGLYTKNGYLYYGDGNGKLDDSVVTGLTVPAGATLVSLTKPQPATAQLLLRMTC